MQKGRVGEVETHFGYVETDPTGRYGRFDEILGKGAMKTVYKAIDEVLGMEVAWSQIKLDNMVQSANNLQRLNSEVHLLSTLNHDSIVRFYTSWIDVDRRTFNFITELFSSGTLREYRKKYNRLGICAIKIWARQILSGLVYLHCHNPPVIHRDIKCDNIFVNGHLGQVKIGDLGLAAVLQDSRRAHSVIGTPEFMAPELYEENYNELVDIYSFGMSVLEMLTSEYPYSECTNPAQIYKKVTSEKLPRAFYKVESLEAQSFISKCLAPVSKRLSAAELLLDPFLVSEGEKYLPVKPAIEVGHLKPFLNENLRIEELQLTDNPSRTKMTITGSLNAEDNTIFLKVKLSDEEGSSKNVYFPFDILTDTPLDVAIEMVKELEITDWEPFEIADMIDGEISLLAPNWRKCGRDRASHSRISKYDEENDSHHFYSYSSFSCSSCASLGGTVAPPQIGDRNDVCNWLRDDLFDDTSSQGTIRSGKYSNLNYCSIEEHYNDKSPRGYEQQHLIANTQNYPEQNSITRSSSKSGWVMDRRRLTRNRSLVDMRSQLLHRTFVEEINKRRLFKTAGALEDVGFQSPLGRSHSQRKRSVVKCQKQKERRA